METSVKPKHKWLRPDELPKGTPKIFDMLTLWEYVHWATMDTGRRKRTNTRAVILRLVAEEINTERDISQRLGWSIRLYQAGRFRLAEGDMFFAL